MECLVKSDTDKSSERRSFKNAENEKKRNINHVEYHKKCNCIVRLMMQFDSSNFALYLFTVMLYKQSTGGRKKSYRRPRVWVEWHSPTVSNVFPSSLLIGKKFLRLQGKFFKRELTF